MFFVDDGVLMFSRSWSPKSRDDLDAGNGKSGKEYAQEEMWVSLRVLQELN